MPSKWLNYINKELYYVNSNNYDFYSIFDFIIKIMKINKTDDIKKLAIDTIKKLFGSQEGFTLLYYLINYKNTICKDLNIKPNTQLHVIYEKFNKLNIIQKEEFINNIIPKFDISEIHLYSIAELLDIIIIVIHHRTYALLNKSTSTKYKRNSVQDVSETCSLFINDKLKNSNRDKYPLIIIYSNEKRLYFVHKQYYKELYKASSNIKNIIEYKLKNFKKLV